MLCETKTNTQLLLAGLAVNPDQNVNQTPQEITLDSLEKQRQYARQWRSKNRERCREYSRLEYRRNHSGYRERRGTPEYKEKLRRWMKLYRAAHPERFRAALRRSNAKHREKRKAYRVKPENRERRRSRERFRFGVDDQFALAKRFRSRMTEVFGRNNVVKPQKTESLLGCTISEAKSHIESQFVNGMSWADRRSFVVDHIVPIAAFNLRDIEEARWAFNWRNLRPITAHENSVKSDTIPNPLPDWLPDHISARILARSAPPSHPLA